MSASWSATSATATGPMRATEDIDVVFHCAALKHVESSEYNPFEATQTNIVGTQNVDRRPPRCRGRDHDPDRSA